MNQFRNRFRYPLIGGILVVSLLSFGLAACGDDDDDGDDEAPATATTASGGGGSEAVIVEVADNSFPAETRAEAGQVVRWDFSGANNPHSVVGTSENAEDLISSQQFPGGEGEYEVTFDDPGTYEYECGVHGSAMTGKVIVS